MQKNESEKSSLPLVRCMVFLRDKGATRRKAGLGTHPFGRVPIAGEYVSLDREEGPTYKVTHVHHTGFGSHQAELYVIEADDVEKIGGEDNPPPG